MTQRAITVLMPVRNAAATVAVALRSVLRSRGVDFDVVVVDHGSSDDTRRIVERIGGATVVDGSGAVDVAAALTLGLASCSAPLVARMDGDDVMHPDRLRADVAHMAEHPELAAVACRVKLVPKRAARGPLASYVA